MNDERGMETHGSEPGGERVWRPHPDVLMQRLEGRAILLNLQSDRFFELNATGTRFWELLSEGLTRAAIARQLLAEFAVDEEQLAVEIDRLADALAREQLIAAVHAASAGHGPLRS